LKGTNYRFLIPGAILNKDYRSPSSLIEVVKQYMTGRYPNYELLEIEDCYALCRYVEADKGGML
jgi:hypothetical protein